MPKSRKRRKAHRSRSHRRTTPRRPRVTDDPHSARFRQLMEAMVAVDRAEVRGDAPGALDIIDATALTAAEQPFWKPSRVRRLTQIDELGALLPGWARSRWILEQALSVLDQSSRDRTTAALETAIEARGGLAGLPGVDQVDARARVVDHDWLYRQLFLYELGGLQHFLDMTGSVALVAGADGIRDWAYAEMGGYRLLRQTSMTITWEDLATGAEVDVVNIGAASLVDEGECALGRVVPIRHGLMFETAPLRVPEEVAIHVASAPEDWPARLVAARQKFGAGTDSGIVLSGPFDYGLVTDVPRALWQHLANPQEESDLVEHHEHDPIVLALRLLTLCLGAHLLAEDGDGLGRVWPAVGAALTEPGLVDHVDRLVAPSLAEHWQWLAGRLPAPAGDIADELVQLCREAA